MDDTANNANGPPTPLFFWGNTSQMPDLVAYCFWHSDSYSGIYSTDRKRVPGCLFDSKTYYG